MLIFFRLRRFVLFCALASLFPLVFPKLPSTLNREKAKASEVLSIHQGLKRMLTPKMRDYQKDRTLLMLAVVFVAV